MNKLFFELIRVALGNAVCLSHTPKIKEWQMLYEMAKKQSLVGICFAGVQRLQMQQQTPPEQLYMQWMSIAAKIQQRNEVVNRQCAELRERLKVKGYRYAILKGQGVASLYHQNCGESSNSGSDPAREKTEGNLTLLRQSGDIDVLLWKDGLSASENRKAVMEYARQIDPETTGSAHHVAVHMWRDTEVELHYEASYMCNPWANKRLQEWMRANRVKVERGCV